MNSENPNEDAPMKIEGAKNSRAKIIDCTIRDGGLMNSSRFSDKTVRAVYDCCADSGAEYMEIGFKNSKKIFSPAEYGAWRFCDEGDIARIIGGRPRNVKLSVMADAGKSDYKTDILDKSRSPIDLVRVACYSRQLDEALDMAKDAKDKGYEVSINLMAACKLSERQMMSDIERLAESDADILYLMDSFGSFYCKHVAALMKALEGICRPRGKKIGFHAHNNLQLAFAKTVQAEECGADFLDSTLGGLGRGAGNCNTELLLGYLGRDIAPAMRCVQREIEPMRQKLGWGFAQSYMIAGFLNQHPRAAMAYQEKTPDADILEFYEASKAAKDAEITARGRTAVRAHTAFLRILYYKQRNNPDSFKEFSKRRADFRATPANTDPSLICRRLPQGRYQPAFSPPPKPPLRTLTTRSSKRTAPPRLPRPSGAAPNPKPNPPPF